MIPEHLQGFRWKAEFFTRLKNGTPMLSGNGVVALSRQLGVTRRDVTLLPMIPLGSGYAVAVTVRVYFGDRTFDGAASASTSEFKENKWKDRRQYNMVQMTVGRAWSQAIRAAIFMSNEDVTTIADELGVVYVDPKAGTHMREPEETEEEAVDLSNDDMADLI